MPQQKNKGVVMTTPQLDTTQTAEDLGQQLFTMGTEQPDFLDERTSGLYDLLMKDPDKVAKSYAYARVQFGLAGNTALELVCIEKQISAARRDPDIDLTQAMEDLSGLLSRMHDELDVTPKQLLAISLVWYNIGLIRRGQRNYLGAAHAQEMSALYATQAGGAAEKVMTAMYIAAVERTTAALVTDDHDQILAAFEHQLGVCRQIQALHGGYTGWMKGNASLHNLWANMLAGGDDYDGKDVDEAYMLHVDNHWSSVGKLIPLMKADDWNGVIEQADAGLAEFGDTKSSSIANTLLTCLLLKAGALDQKGMRAKAIKCLEQVRDWDGRDGGAPMAVARRLLEEMKAD